MGGLSATAALRQLHVVGQELDRAVEQAPPFERLHQSLLETEILEAASLRERNRLGLLVIIAQHEPRDLVGHRRKQDITLRAVEQPLAHRRIERDLEVHLQVRGVDPGGFPTNAASVLRERPARSCSAAARSLCAALSSAIDIDNGFTTSIRLLRPARRLFAQISLINAAKLTDIDPQAYFSRGLSPGRLPARPLSRTSAPNGMRCDVQRHTLTLPA